jgi:hypothetical protein
MFFSQMPDGLITTDGVTLAAIKVWHHVYVQTLGRPGWDLTYQQIAAATGLHRVTVINAVTWLVDSGWLIKSERADRPNVYTICREPHVPWSQGVAPALPGGSAKATSDGSPEATHPKSPTPKNTPVTPEPEPLALVETPPPAGDGGFDAFWTAYPNHASGRKRAEVAWRKATHRVGGVRPQVIMDALRLFIRSEQWQRDGGRYVPHATTWLNQERYLEPPAPKSRRPFADAL